MMMPISDVEFGAGAPTIRFTGATSDVIMDAALLLVGPDDVQISGDRAVVPLKLPAPVAAALGEEGKKYNGLPLHFVRDAGGWKLDALQSVSMNMIDANGRSLPGESNLVEAYHNAFVLAADDVIAGMASGKIVEPQQAQAAWNERIAVRLRESRVLNRIQGTSTVPKLPQER